MYCNMWLKGKYNNDSLVIYMCVYRSRVLCYGRLQNRMGHAMNESKDVPPHVITNVVLGLC